MTKDLTTGHIACSPDFKSNHSEDKLGPINVLGIAKQFAREYKKHEIAKFLAYIYESGLLGELDAKPPLVSSLHRLWEQIKPADQEVFLAHAESIMKELGL